MRRYRGVTFFPSSFLGWRLRELFLMTAVVSLRWCRWQFHQSPEMFSSDVLRWPLASSASQKAFVCPVGRHHGGERFMAFGDSGLEVHISGLTRTCLQIHNAWWDNWAHFIGWSLPNGVHHKVLHLRPHVYCSPTRLLVNRTLYGFLFQLSFFFYKRTELCSVRLIVPRTDSPTWAVEIHSSSGVTMGLLVHLWSLLSPFGL